MTITLWADIYPQRTDKSCSVCGTPDSLKPMCFRGEKWCSDDCKKVLNGEITLEQWNKLHADRI